MTLELDSKPTRTRRTRSLEEQVAEADAIPYVPFDDTTPAWLAESRAKRAAAEDESEAAKWAAFDARTEIAEVFRTEDTGEIEMSPEALAELRARAAHMGLGGPQEPTILVTGYDANGEAIDAEVVRSARAQDAAATGDPDQERPAIKQIEMPGFEGHRATKVTLSFGGSITLNLGYAADKAMWDALTWQSHAGLNITAFVNGKGFKTGKDNIAGASLTVLNARLANDAEEQELGEDETFTVYGLAEALAQDDGPLDDAAGPDEPQPYEEIEQLPEPSELDQALAAALEGDQ